VVRIRLDSAQHNRVAGVLVGQAIGDALGVPYEFGARIDTGDARMIGGGLGPYAPGEYSDDTQMAVAIARTGLDSGYALYDSIAGSFIAWRREQATDIGNATRAVLDAGLRNGGGAQALWDAAAEFAARTGRAAGNGALMRTGVVALAALDDAELTAEHAANIARLTHADPLAIESAVLWTEAVRVAVVEGRIDLRGGLRLLPDPSRSYWSSAITEAESCEPRHFRRNGFTVTALQASWSSIWHTRHLGVDQVEAGLQTAVGIGHDTDTVAAITGVLLGARYGMSGLPSNWVRHVRGPDVGFRAPQLVAAAFRAASRNDLGRTWPQIPSMLGVPAQTPLAVGLAGDPGVLLGTEADLARVEELGVTAVVSLSRVGRLDVPELIAPENRVEVWLIDSEDPSANAHLEWTLRDVARTVRALREAGERVLLHCVAAHHRTPSVALVYLRLLGIPTHQAIRDIEAAVGHPVSGLLWRTATEMEI